MIEIAVVWQTALFLDWHHYCMTVNRTAMNVRAVTCMILLSHDVDSTVAWLTVLPIDQRHCCLIDDSTVVWMTALSHDLHHLYMNEWALDYVPSVGASEKAEQQQKIRSNEMCLITISLRSHLYREIGVFFHIFNEPAWPSLSSPLLMRRNGTGRWAAPISKVFNFELTLKNRWDFFSKSLGKLPVYLVYEQSEYLNLKLIWQEKN